MSDEKKAVGLFDYINSINTSKENLMDGDIVAEKKYPAYMVNKALGFFQETVSYAQLMNQNSHLSNKMQYLFLLNTVRPAKRFTKWPKKFKDDRIDTVIEHYQCNEERALEILNLITDEEFDQIKKLTFKGGLNGK